MSQWATSNTHLQTIANALTGQGLIQIPIASWTIAATGAPLAEFSNGVSTTPGLDLVDSETIGIRWNNDAAPAAIGCNVFLPMDLDTDYDMTFHAIVSKTGATAGDATTLTVTYFNNAVGALHDADSNAGGVTNAVTGAAAAKTTARLYRAIAAADLATPPAFAHITCTPTAGLLGTDDFVIHATFLTYTKQAPRSF